MSPCPLPPSHPRPLSPSAPPCHRPSPLPPPHPRPVDGQDHVNRRWLGCHSDYGFAQTPRGFYANLVYNPSFANYGECDTAAGCVASSKVMATPSDWHCSQQDAKLATASSSSARPSVNIKGAAGRDAFVANRGVGNAGLYLEAGKPSLRRMSGKTRLL